MPYLRYFKVNASLTDKEIEDDVSDYDIEGAEVDERGGRVVAVRLPAAASATFIYRHYTIECQWSIYTLSK